MNILGCLIITICIICSLIFAYHNNCLMVLIGFLLMSSIYYFVGGYKKVINDTKLGQSILNNIYETTEPVSLGYSMYDKNFYLDAWKDVPTLANPLKYDYRIKLPTGIQFQIIDVSKKWNFEVGTTLSTKIRLLQNIPINSVSDILSQQIDYLEADKVKDKGYKLTKYVHKNIMETNNEYLNPILDKKHKRLKTKYFKLDLYTFMFFDYKYDDIEKNNPIKNNNLIKRVI